MFGLFESSSEEDAITTHHYEGSVISSDYNLDCPEDYPFHSLCPQGEGKITYFSNGEVVEYYEGEFDGGQYSGQGKLTRNGEVFEGIFKENKFVGSE